MVLAVQEVLVVVLGDPQQLDKATKGWGGERAPAALFSSLSCVISADSAGRASDVSYSHATAAAGWGQGCWLYTCRSCWLAAMRCVLFCNLGDVVWGPWSVSRGSASHHMFQTRWCTMCEYQCYSPTAFRAVVHQKNNWVLQVAALLTVCGLMWSSQGLQQHHNSPWLPGRCWFIHVWEQWCLFRYYAHPAQFVSTNVGSCTLSYHCACAWVVFCGLGGGG